MCFAKRQATNCKQARSRNKRSLLQFVNLLVCEVRCERSECSNLHWFSFVFLISTSKYFGLLKFLTTKYISILFLLKILKVIVFLPYTLHFVSAANFRHKLSNESKLSFDNIWSCFTLHFVWVETADDRQATDCKQASIGSSLFSNI